MALPNPSMSFTPFDILTAEEMNNLVENIESLAAGTGFTAGSIPNSAMALNAQPQQIASDTGYDFVRSGLVITGDSYGSTRAASMTAGIVYINGIRIPVSAVVARTYTASRDTYIDVNSSGTVVYTEVTNNAASPALSANSIRIGIVVTGASNIANVGSINQGQETKLLPVASSIYYTVTDSLGNLICCRDPQHRTLSVRRRTTQFSTSSSTAQLVTGLTAPVIIPTGRKYKARLNVTQILNNTSGQYAESALWEGTIGSGAMLAAQSARMGTASMDASGNCESVPTTPGSSNPTINAAFRNPAGGGTADMIASLGTGIPISIVVELA